MSTSVEEWRICGRFGTTLVPFQHVRPFEYLLKSFQGFTGSLGHVLLAEKKGVLNSFCSVGPH